jgi:polyhydroxyalkanoate synthesis repressor PhaR
MTDLADASPTADTGAKSSHGKKGGDRVVIKKYANRRLYNTASSSYVTLEHLSEMVKDGVDFLVFDAKTNEDITRSVLTQIIFEEESRGQNLLPIQFLRQLIRFYGDQMQSFVPSYLEMSLEAFARQQETMQKQMSGALGGQQGFGLFEDQVRQNLAMFDRAMKMFTPFAYPPRVEDTGDSKPVSPGSDPDTIAELKRQMEEMQAKLAKLSEK